MATITLDDRDRAVLKHLRDGATDVDALAERVSADRAYLRDRLPALADNGLVARIEPDVYDLTDGGRRALEATGDGTADDRVDTPPAVEGRILAFDLRPDREAALRDAFSFLRYWGEASSGEIIDGVYSEHPAGYDDYLTWWRECVRDRLAELPTVEPPPSDALWRFDGTPVVDSRTDDGRRAADAGIADRTSVAFALTKLDLDDGELAAVRRVFDLLVEVRAVSATETQEQVYLDHPAGYRSPTDWWRECVRPALAEFPGVERTDDDRGRWRYHLTDE